jgi:hypothetical protein
MSLVVLCASHLKTERNVEQIIEMLDSQMAQTRVCDVYVSYTGLSLHYDNPRVHLIKQPEEHLTQFQHYKRLVCELLAIGVIHSENYAIFTDDDDIMAPERNAEYLRLLCPGLEVALIDKSVVRFSTDCDTNQLATTVWHMRPREYVDLCLRGDLIMNFINMVPVDKYYSDCMFNKVVYNYLNRHPDTCIEVVAEKPLYYYRYEFMRGVRHKYGDETA